MTVMIGNLIYGTDGWAAMDDRRCVLYKGESNEVLQELRADASGGGDSTGEHMANFLAAVRSRKYQDMRGEIANEAMNAALCHLANIAYRVGRTLQIEASPTGIKFKGDAEADKLLTRDPYRKPYVV